MRAKSQAHPRVHDPEARVRPQNDGLIESVRAYASSRRLSPRQIEIIVLHLRGRNDKELATTFGCTEATIYEHWSRMAQKCGRQFKSDVVTDFHAFLFGHTANLDGSIDSPESAVGGNLGCPDFQDSSSGDNADTKSFARAALAKARE